MATNTPTKAPVQNTKQTGPASKTATAAAAPSTATSVAGDDPARAIEKLETKTKAINANNIARVANSQLSSNSEKLQPLMSLKTNKPIEKFPATSKDINGLTLTMLDAMLNALEADRTGSEATKRERLRVQIGLKSSPA